MRKSIPNNPWYWVPPLYLTEGIPYVLIITVSVIMYKNLGVDNSAIGLYTSFLYLPWVIKPFWSPLVDLYGTKRKWFLAMQLVLSLAFLGVGLSLPTNQFFIISLAFFWLASFASATNDIASDGFYLLALKEEQQSFFIGLRSTFYRVAMVTGQGLFVIFAGYLEVKYGDNTKAWSLTMVMIAALMFILTLVNFLVTPNVEKAKDYIKEESLTFWKVFESFFRKKEIWVALAFILFYRLGESQLVKMASPFLLDSREVGGLALSTSDVGLIYGTFGIIALSLGGIIGGIVISRDGLGKWMLPMILALNVPNFFYYVLAYFQPESAFYAGAVVVIEQLGYGFGFAAFMMYLIYVSEGPSKTSHYAIATGFMALGMMLPGMASGFIQEALGYPGFFIWIVIAAFPGILMVRYVKFPYEYGKKRGSGE
ncbi:MFS transporter, PAT family, beta-lactamase induction signal transducer AmpG [Aquiflexum balticum DSM 16537]|uniref:MFS transporter, PAT family, beta-lactamase induction signal transducer AmpG n=1 Tax=Aquiflexum balticum DSM 16537 TaxID=758820 RepID=A0A1W2HAM2_9BACT|nr:MFS transporter [Aquiflexum balticum]SMD45940.1 MFS transporter, PAT family, beta-lactamase induction signal transducer AmpG [Aquiflexum balticum DSM 16537]